MPLESSEVGAHNASSSQRGDLFGFCGRTVAHFRVLEPLGAGGVGVVYRAEDTRLGRAVALKFLLPQYGIDDAAKERFLVEARSAGALDHANLCTVYEAGETSDGHLYLAMALYAGETLPNHRLLRLPVGREWRWAVGRRTARTRIVFGAAALLVASGLTWYTFGRTRTGDIPPERSIAVLPFDNMGSIEDDAYLAGGLQDAVITQLTKVTDLRVISSQSVRTYAGSKKSARDIGQELAVGRILQASVQRAGDSVRVSAHLVDARSDKDLWANQYERAATDLFALETDIAMAIVTALQPELTTAEERSLTRRPTRSAEAYAFFLQGREYQQRPTGRGTIAIALTDQELRAAESLYRRALAADSAFALAHAQLALVLGDLRDRARARAEAETALRLDPDLPEGHLAMGRYWEVAGDRGRALAEYEIARRGMPNDGPVATRIALIRRRQGRWQDALAGFEHAASVDPRASANSMFLAMTYAGMRRYAESVRAWDYAIAIAPDDYRYVLERGRVWATWEERPDSLEATLRRLPPDFDPEAQTTFARVDLARLRRRPADGLAALAAMRPEFFNSDDRGVAGWLRLLRAWMYEMLGDGTRARADFDGARAIFEAEVAKFPDFSHNHSDLALAYAGLGRREDAVREARRALELQPLSMDAYNAPINMDHAAEVYMRVGDMDAAVDVLEQLSTIPNWVGLGFPAQLRFDPRWDPLRRHARFQRLVNR